MFLKFVLLVTLCVSSLGAFAGSGTGKIQNLSGGTKRLPGIWNRPPIA